MKNKTKLLTGLEIEFNVVVEKYINKFVKKHGYEFSNWVSDEIGSIACFIDQYFFNFDDIRYDIDNNIKKELIFRWQDDGVEDGGKNNINFKSYIKGLRYEDLKKLNNITVLKTKKVLKLIVKSNSGLDMSNLVESKYPYAKIISKGVICSNLIINENGYHQKFKIKMLFLTNSPKYYS